MVLAVSWIDRKTGVSPLLSVAWSHRAITVIQKLHRHLDERPVYFAAAQTRLREIVFHVPLTGRHAKKIPPYGTNSSKR
jgi:hypothetical protein